MLAMGRALMARPRVIIMDEPSMGLAPVMVESVFELIVRLNELGITIFMVEQNATLALSIADRGYVIQNGRIVLDGHRGAASRQRADAHGIPRRVRRDRSAKGDRSHEESMAHGRRWPPAWMIAGPRGGAVGLPGPIKIAVVGPFSGRGAEAGERVASAVKMAVEEVNAAGGLLGREGRGR